jgi:DNA invertase Pin-like site-specific DNA recombinase
MIQSLRTALAASAMLFFAGSAAAQGACAQRGLLDARYCDENGDLVADLPKDPKALQNPATLVFSYTPVEDPAVYENVFTDFLDHLAKVTGATLVIEKLDRLSRNAAFLLALRDSGVRFVAVDMPEAIDLTVGIIALVAQAEREAISRRTKEALAVAKARGVRLGNPNGAESLRRAGKGGAALRAAVYASATAFAADLTPVLAAIQAAGYTSLRAIAAELAARGIQTRRGGKWNVGNVLILLRRRPQPMPIPAWVSTST